MNVGVLFWSSSMDYKRQYDLLMEKARQRGTVEGYKERHHIIPRCMGGSNKKENLVELSAREHYVAHRLLYMYYKTPQTAAAWFAMAAYDTQHNKVSARKYELARKTMSAVRTGAALSAEHRKRISDGSKGRVAWNKGKKLSVEHRKKVSDSLKGHTVSAETRKKLSDAGKNKKYTEETLIKFRARRRVVSVETRKKISESNKKRWERVLTNGSI